MFRLFVIQIEGKLEKDDDMCFTRHFLWKLSVFCLREYLKMLYIVQTTVDPPPRELHVVIIRNNIPKITDTSNGTQELRFDVWLQWKEKFKITYLFISFSSLLFRVRSKGVMIWKERKNSVQFEWKIQFIFLQFFFFLSIYVDSE